MAPRTLREHARLFLTRRGRAERARERFPVRVQRGIRRRMGRDHTPDMELIQFIPRDKEMLRMTMGVMDQAHHNLSNAYAEMTYGERAAELNRWFLAERVGLNEAGLRGKTEYAPSAVRDRVLKPLDEGSAEARRIATFQEEIERDPHMHDRVKRMMVSSLDFMRRGGAVRELWPGIMGLRDVNKQLKTNLKDPIGGTPEELGGKLK